MTVTPSTTGDNGFDGPTSDDPSARGGWISQWTDLLFWPWRELPAVVRSVAGQLISMTERSAPPMDEVAILCRELDAVRAATAALQRRVAALEAQPRDDAPREDDETDVPRLPMRASDAFSKVLARAGEVAAQRGLTTGTGSATLVGDRGQEVHAEADSPPRPSRKAPRSRRNRS